MHADQVHLRADVVPSGYFSSPATREKIIGWLG
jgi:hypothetical protein